MTRKNVLRAAVAALALSATALCQQPATDNTGFTSSVEFGGSAGSGEHVLKLDTDAGYNFSQHVGVNFGVPFYFAGGSTTSTTGGKTSYSSSGIGAPHAAVVLNFANPSVNYTTAGTVFFPAGDTTHGLSSGQTSFDWNNRFEHAFGRVTPFGEAGISNTMVDTRQFNRPYTTHGNNAHLLGGLGVDLTDKINWGASVYDIAPWGTQTVYSRTVAHQSGAAAVSTTKAQNNRFFAQNGVTTGTADIAKDDGFSTWVDLSPSPVVEIEVGYTRSVRQSLNEVSFGVKVDVAKLAKSQRKSQ